MRRFFPTALAALLALVLSAGPASAQYVGVSPPNVGPVDVGNILPNSPNTGIDTSVLGASFRNVPPANVTPAPATNVLGTANVAPGTNVLAARTLAGSNVSAAAQVVPQVSVQSAQVRSLVVTGADIAALSLMALALVTVGAALVYRARRSEG